MIARLICTYTTWAGRCLVNLVSGRYVLEAWIVGQGWYVGIEKGENQQPKYHPAPGNRGMP